MVGFVQLILLLLKLCDIYLSYRVLEQTETKGLYLRLTGPHDGIFFSRLFILLLNPPQSKKKKICPHVHRSAMTPIPSLSVDIGVLT